MAKTRSYSRFSAKKREREFRKKLRAEGNRTGIDTSPKKRWERETPTQKQAEWARLQDRKGKLGQLDQKEVRRSSPVRQATVSGLSTAKAEKYVGGLRKREAERKAASIGYEPPQKTAEKRDRKPVVRSSLSSAFSSVVNSVRNAFGRAVSMPSIAKLSRKQVAWMRQRDLGIKKAFGTPAERSMEVSAERKTPQKVVAKTEPLERSSILGVREKRKEESMRRLAEMKAELKKQVMKQQAARGAAVKRELAVEEQETGKRSEGLRKSKEGLEEILLPVTHKSVVSTFKKFEESRAGKTKLAAIKRYYSNAQLYGRGITTIRSVTDLAMPYRGKDIYVLKPMADYFLAASIFAREMGRERVTRTLSSEAAEYRRLYNRAVAERGTKVA